LKNLIRLRKSTPLLSGNDSIFINSGNPHVFGYFRQRDYQQILILNNFSDFPQQISKAILQRYGIGWYYQDLISRESFSDDADLSLAPFQYRWLRNAP
jgi:amylosucrase/maltose alpha-D-glucosyltransferase/alpha-amylase